MATTSKYNVGLRRLFETAAALTFCTGFFILSVFFHINFGGVSGKSTESLYMYEIEAACDYSPTLPKILALLTVCSTRHVSVSVSWCIACACS